MRIYLDVDSLLEVVSKILCIVILNESRGGGTK
jgi:hypothetical protein